MASSRKEVPVIWNILSDTAPFLGTGQMEPTVAVFLTAHDGGPALAADAAVLPKPSSSISSGSGASPGSPTAAGRAQPLLGLSPQSHLAEEAPVPEPVWSCWEPDASHSRLDGWPFFQGVWAKPW